MRTGSDPHSVSGGEEPFMVTELRNMLIHKHGSDGSDGSEPPSGLNFYLHSYVQLGGFLGRARSFINGSVQIYRHGEDWSVNRARLGQQAVLQPRPDLVQPHQSVHGLVGVDGFTVED